jgi:hypothetical protein
LYGLDVPLPQQEFDSEDETVAASLLDDLSALDAVEDSRGIA